MNPLHRWVLGYWMGEGNPLLRSAVTAVTAPASLLFGVGVRLRNQGWETGLLRATSPAIPVISVGNLSVGGTGKTPVVRWVVSRLLARGERPAILSRGYGADEVALHALWHPGVPVHIHPERVRAARAAAEGGATVAVVDDGFQHRALARDADIVLVSAHDPFPPRLLPRGPWREPLSSLGRASLVLTTGKGPEGVERADALLAVLRTLPRHPPMGRFGLVAGGWYPLPDATAAPTTPDGLPEGPAGAASGVAPSPPRDAPENDFPEGPLLVVASVARPETVVELVASRAEGVELLAFPDHHRYDAGDVARILRQGRGRTIVTTEKDAVKLGAFPALREPGSPPIRVLALAPLPGPETERLLDRVLARALARGREGPVPKAGSGERRGEEVEDPGSRARPDVDGLEGRA